MVQIVTPRVEVSGATAPERIYVPVQVETGVLSSSDRLTVEAPGRQPAVIEVRENTAGTFRATGATVAL